MGNGAGYRYIENVPVDLAGGSVTQTTSTNSTAVEIDSYGTVRLTLNVTAASGTTPSLTATVQTSSDGTGSGTGVWRNLGAFTAATGVTAQRACFSGADKYVRLSTAITGTTPSFTFSCSGEAV